MAHEKKSGGMMGEIKKDVLIGVGVAALAAAGTYFLYGSKNAEKHRKQVKSWMLLAKGEILEQLESLTNVDDQIYHKIVKEVADKYHKLKNIDPAEIQGFVTELRGYWDKMKGEGKSVKKKAVAKILASKLKKVANKKSKK